MNNALTLRNINKSFHTQNGDLTILNDLSLELPIGQIAAIIAPSGAGKSTLLHIAGLMDEVDSGEIIIDGKQTKNMNSNQQAKIRLEKIGYVYQQHHLLPEFTALENVMMPLLIAGLNRKTATKRAKSALTQMKLANRAHHLPSALSGGEQQRIAIARAIINAPKILLADEPTGNLDPDTSDLVFNTMIESLRKRKAAGLIVTHNHQLAKSLDIVYLLEKEQLTPIDKKKLRA